MGKTLHINSFDNLEPNPYEKCSYALSDATH